MRKLLSLLLAGIFSFSLITNVFGALTKTSSSVDDWTACAANIINEGTTVDISDSYESVVHIQAALDSTTAHEGTKFIVQVSANTTGDEDWQNFTEFVELIGTAVTDLIEDNPLAAGSTSITLTAHTFTVEGKWLLIEDATLANSELVFVDSQSTNAVVVLDGTTNAHVLNTAMYNVAFTKDVAIPLGYQRVRVVVDNSYDDDGTLSSLNYKIRITEVTGL